MTGYQRALTGLAVLLGIKAGVFLIFAAFDLTQVSAVLLAGLAATWLALGLLLMLLAQRIGQYEAHKRARPTRAQRWELSARQTVTEHIPELGRGQ